MDKPTKKLLRCAIYTRKSTEHNLDLEFNSLDAQREACEAYIKSQAHEGWRLIPDHYDDGGLSGASLDRPALQTLLAEHSGAGRRARTSGGASTPPLFGRSTHRARNRE
jgi:site-specific DNA recombinase